MSNEPEESEESVLSKSWDFLIPDIPDPVPGVHREPGEFVMATSLGRVLVRISPTGRVVYGPGYQPDDVAEEFWTCMALKRKGMEERLMHLGILEQMLIRLGQTDLRYEQAQLQADTWNTVLVACAEDAHAKDRAVFEAERCRLALQHRVHEIMEFSRALVRRPSDPGLDQEVRDPGVGIDDGLHNVPEGEGVGGSGVAG